jgi:hypothetical protein
VVKPEDDGSGWTFEIGDAAKEGRDGPGYIYLLTPPWRGRHPTYLYAGYGEAAQDVPLESEFFFLLRPQDEARADHQLHQAIFSGASQPQETSLRELSRLPRGWGRFKAVDADIQPGSWHAGLPPTPEMEQHDRLDDAARLRLFGAVRGLRFVVTLTVPHSHRLPAGLDARPSACGPAWPF